MTIKAHFDGNTIVFDEPANLVPGQAVTVVVQPDFSVVGDTTAALMSGETDERDAMHIDPLEQVPADFVRQPGSGAGEIKMADDFDETPADFKDYL